MSALPPGADLVRLHTQIRLAPARGDGGSVVRLLLACARARCRRRTQRSAPYRKGADRLGKWRRSWRQSWREYFSRRLDDPRARIWTWDAGSRRRWNAGSRQRRRHLILQGAHLRRQQGELTGYSFQIRLLGSGALHERHQNVGVLLLRRLNVPQARPDNWIRYEDGSRDRRRRYSDTFVIWRGEAAEVRQGEPIDARQRDLKIRQREATKTRQEIGGGGTNDGKGAQAHGYHRHLA